MKFSEMPYKRLELADLKAEAAAITKEFESAETYGDARAAFLKKDAFDRKVQTVSTIASIRHSIDTRDEFYDAESTYWNEAGPALEEELHKFTIALINSKFRPEFEAEFGSIIFKAAEMDLKAFSPEIIGEMQEENNLTMTYEKLLASA
ncbi:MAG: M3 family oligoendopeptidase, partial [Lachnospiraceae bacterium]|nr:M3 family oligoendopeptidase [Lachnospiraceae bacterium]